MSENPVVSIPVAGDSAVLARRYVGVLLELAEEGGVIEAVVADMTALRQVWKESNELRAIAADPRWGGDKLKAVVSELVRICNISGLTSNLLLVAAQNLRLGLLPVMVEKFFEELDIRRGEFVAHVRVARKMPDAQLDALSASLSAAISGKVRLSVMEDPSIIGGMTVRLGSQFIDASVKTRLDRLECTLRGAA